MELVEGEEPRGPLPLDAALAMRGRSPRPWNPRTKAASSIAT